MFKLGQDVDAVLFDLDGTLVDSLADLSMAANAARDAIGLPALSLARVGQFVGKGAVNLVHRVLTDALDGQASPEDFACGMAAFKHTYHEVNGRYTTVLPGVMDVLTALQKQCVPMGIVTNKPAEFTLPLLRLTGLAAYFDVVVSGDTCAEVKPSPLPVLYACKQLQQMPQRVLFVGDSKNDVLAAQAAGCPVCLIAGGYHESADDHAADFGAEFMLPRFDMLMTLFVGWQ